MTYHEIEVKDFLVGSFDGIYTAEASSPQEAKKEFKKHMKEKYNLNYGKDYKIISCTPE